MSRTIIPLLLCLLTFPMLSAAQNNELLPETWNVDADIDNEEMELLLEDVRANFSRITHTVDWVQIDTVELQQSTEGGVAIIYHGENGREKLTERHYGEMGQTLTEYFFSEGELTVVYEFRAVYDRPAYMEGMEMHLFSTHSFLIGDELILQISKRPITFLPEEVAEMDEIQRIYGRLSDLIEAIDASQSHDDRTLIGVWQSTPVLGSGWSDNYQFFEDGRFHYNHNQMMCNDSVITESGTYTITDGTIELTFTSSTVLSGATLQPSSGSCASDEELVGGTIVQRPLHRTESYAMAFVSPLFDFEYLERILLDGTEYFRLLHDPNDYE